MTDTVYCEYCTKHYKRHFYETNHLFTKKHKANVLKIIPRCEDCNCKELSNSVRSFFNKTLCNNCYIHKYSLLQECYDCSCKLLVAEERNLSSNYYCDKCNDKLSTLSLIDLYERVLSLHKKIDTLDDNFTDNKVEFQMELDTLEDTMNSKVNKEYLDQY